MEDNSYSGDMILINRLANFISNKTFEWNLGEPVTLQDISYAILLGQTEEIDPFGDDWKNPPLKNKSTKWHIGRVLYFINHPNEIKNIDIDNLCDNYNIFPIPLITDGNHRFLAAIWLHGQGKLDKVHCRYGGRVDLLNYLTGSSEYCPEN